MRRPQALLRPHLTLFRAAKREEIMRRVFTLIAVLVVAGACSKTDAPPADTTQTNVAMTPEAPMPLTEASVAGTWTGTSTPVASDSVVAKWTQVCANGACKGTSEGSTVVIESTYTIAGDSSVGVSKPYSDPAFKGGKLIDTWVAHISGDLVTGTGAAKLASRPDSVVMRYRFSGTRTR